MDSDVTGILIRFETNFSSGQHRSSGRSAAIIRGEDKTLRDGVSSRFLRNVSMVKVEFVHRSRIDILRSGRINLFIRNSRSVYLRRKSSRVLRAYRGKRDIAPFIHCV